jgi:CheY-like chemotaxis protein
MNNLIKIMLVDDDQAIINILKTKLEKTGKFAVVFTTEGKKALSLAKREQPSLIICDFYMPDMFGGDVAQEILNTRKTRHIPVLFLTSQVAETDDTNGMIGKDHIMSKKSDISKIIAKMESMLNATPRKPDTGVIAKIKSMFKK